MIKQIILIIFVASQLTLVNGQGISRHEADSLLQYIKSNRKDIVQLNQLLKLAEFNILKPGEFTADLDSAESFLKQAAILNNIIRSPEAKGYSKLLTALLNKERGLPSRAIFATAVEMLKFTKDKFHLGIAELEVQKFYSPDIPAELSEKMKLMDTAVLLFQQTGSVAQKKFILQELEYNYSFGGFNDKIWEIRLLQNILTISHQIKDRESEVWVHREIAAVHILQGKLSLAENELTGILKNYNPKTDDYLTLVYDNLVDLYFDRGDNDKLLSASLEGVKSVKTSRDSAYLPGFYSKLFWLYYNLEKTDQMMQWASKLRDYFILHRDFIDVYYYNRQVASGLVKQKKPKQALNIVLEIKNKYPPGTREEKSFVALSLGECYAALKKYSLAEQYYLDMVRVNENGKPGKYSANYYNSLGNFYVETKQYRQAGKYIKKALDAHSQLPARIGRTVLLNLFKIDSALGDYPSAIKNLKRYHALKDSIFDVAKTKQFEELQITYQTEQRKRDIKILKENEKIQQIKLQHAENTRNWIIGGAGMLMLLLGVSYNRYLLKKKSNWQLQVQREEIGLINKNLSNLVIEKDGVLMQKDNLLKEKEWLLKEVHHRVKNNLHTVICLLESQARYLENDALKAIESSQHRIYAMSLIHQKLYQSDDVKAIDMAFYLPEFVRYLNDSFGTQRQIRFKMDIEPLMLGVSQAIPIALIVNEAVTNAIKYAFPGSKSGIIDIRMHKVQQEIILVIADNGIGINPVIANTPPESLGLKLMKGLSEDIHASINIKNDNGTKIIIVFTIDPLNDANNLITKTQERKILS